MNLPGKWNVIRGFLFTLRTYHDKDLLGIIEGNLPRCFEFRRCMVQGGRGSHQLYMEWPGAPFFNGLK